MAKVFIIFLIFFSTSTLATNINLYNLEIKTITYEFGPTNKAHAYLTGKVRNEDCAFYISFEGLNSEKLKVFKEVVAVKQKLNLHFAFLYDHRNQIPAPYTGTTFIEAITQHYRASDAQSAMFTFAPKIDEKFLTYIKVID